MSYRVSELDVCCVLEAEAEAGGEVCVASEPASRPGGACDCPEDRPCPADDRFPYLVRRVARRAEGEEARASEDRAAADALYQEILQAPPGERARLVEQQGRYVSFALAERLLSSSLEARQERPQTSQELARLALAIAERLDPVRHGSGLVADLKARSWAYLGEAWLDSAPSAAREAFRLARALLSRGSGDPFEEAEVLSLAASADRDAANPNGPLAELDRAEAVYRAAGDPRLVGDTLLRRARLLARQGEPLGATATLRQAAQVLEEVAAPAELAEIGAETARQLEAAGCPDEAWIELARVRSMAGGTLDSGLRLRLRWIEGRVAAALGLADEARGHLEAAREGFLASGRPREAAAAQLDLAALGAQSDGADYERAMERLESQIHHLVLAARLPREHTAALALLGQAAERRALRPDLVASVTGYLERVA